MKRALILLVLAYTMMGFTMHHRATHHKAVPKKSVRPMAATLVDKSVKLINTSWKLKFYDCENCHGRPQNWILNFQPNSRGTLGNMPINWQMKGDTVSVRIAVDTICQFNRIYFADDNLMYGSQYCKDDVNASHFIASKISVDARQMGIASISTRGINNSVSAATTNTEVDSDNKILYKSSFSFFDKTYMFKTGFDKWKVKRPVDVLIIHSSFCIKSNDPFDVYCVLGEYKRSGVASHYLIDRSGNIHKLVDENNVAHHAGFGKLPDGYNAINTRSIGIEIINNEQQGPTNEQYEALARLTKDIKSRHRIKYIKGHNQIAPDRKTDPWRFSWKIFYDLIRETP
jgi:hypothetical protein